MGLTEDGWRDTQLGWEMAERPEGKFPLALQMPSEEEGRTTGAEGCSLWVGTMASYTSGSLNALKEQLSAWGS